VAIIEPSIGEVRDIPNIISALRATPIRSAERIIIPQSLLSTLSPRSQILGTHDNAAATISDRQTIAIGAIYRPNSRL
jgi:hypothetical protein